MGAPLLAAKLIELRQEHDLSQQVVADYLGVTREAYSHYERNTREPNIEILLRLSQFYQIDISQLINTSLVPIPAIPKKKNAKSYPKQSEQESPTLLKNIDYMSKLFSGKYISIDITDVTRRDLDMLVWYKKLTEQDQAEVRDYIRFKYQNSKKK